MCKNTESEKKSYIMFQRRLTLEGCVYLQKMKRRVGGGGIVKDLKTGRWEELWHQKISVEEQSLEG